MSTRILISKNRDGDDALWYWGIRMEALGMWIEPLPNHPLGSKELAEEAARGAAESLGLVVDGVQE